MCKVYTGYCGTSEIEHGLCACTVDNPRAKAWGIISPYRRTYHALYISHMYVCGQTGTAPDIMVTGIIVG